MKGKDKGGKPRQPHSERAGEAELGSGVRAALYRALQELTCSRCGGVIWESDLFTRETGRASELPLIRLCLGCVPFKVGDDLLDSLLAPEGGGELSPPVSTAGVMEKAMSRLGPALDACRRRCKDTAR